MPTTVAANCASSLPVTAAARCTRTSTPANAAARSCATRRSARTTSTRSGQSRSSRRAAGRTSARTECPLPEELGNHVPAEKSVGTGDQDPHGIKLLPCRTGA